MSRFPASAATGGVRQEGSLGQLVKLLRRFRSDDTGAVTIDWVALTSGMLLLGIMVVYSIFDGGVNSLVTGINNTLSTVQIADVGSDPTIGVDAGVSGPEDENSNLHCFRFFWWVICF